MKRPTTKSRKLHEIRARRRHARRTRARGLFSNYAGSRSGAYQTVSLHGATVERAVVLRPPICVLPADMSFKRNPEATLDALAKMREFHHSRPLPLPKRPRHRNRKVLRTYVDFRPLTKIDIDAALVLVAEFDRLNKMQSKKGVTLLKSGLVNLPEWDPLIVHELNQLGFFELANVHTSMLPPMRDDPDRMTLPFYSGTENSVLERMTDELCELANFAAAGAPDDNMLTFVHTTLAEACSNVTGHAYEVEKYAPPDYVFKYPHVGHFWIGATACRKSGRLKVALFDQGLTIPVTYDRASHLARIKNFLTNQGYREKNDGSYIAAATELGASATEESHRGRGLPQMLNAVRQSEHGTLSLVSRNGRVTYKGAAKPDVQVFQQSVGGTLLSLEVDVRRPNGHVGNEPAETDVLLALEPA